MPTGYTACILEGADFKTFAMRCMRAFGAAAHMRDEPLDKPYEPRKPSAYHDEQLLELRAKFAELKDLDPEARLASALQEYHKKRIALEQEIAGRRANKEKLDAMLRQVKAFHPPSQEHEEFKKFMSKQIIVSESDGDASYCERELKTLKMPMSIADGEQWFEQEKESIVKGIAYHTGEAAKDSSGCKKQNEWASQAIRAIEQTAQVEEVPMEASGRSP
jgi:hypothetical protein